MAARNLQILKATVRLVVNLLLIALAFLWDIFLVRLYWTHTGPHHWPWKLDERWYLCKIEDSFVEDVPDFSKVPEAKREMVRRNWQAKQEAVVETVHLWGPQIAFFKRQPYYKVTVLESPYAD